jgi:hypothetical protein
VHVTGVPGWQTPARQVSAPLHRLLSAQLVPSVTGVCAHAPLASQVSVVHGLPSSQLPPDDVQVPFWQVPVPQTLAPVQVVPLGAFMRTQPLVGLQEATWQVLGLVQVSGVPGWQTPAWHISLPLQTLPSLQLVPSVTGGFEQMPVFGSHTPALWQRSEAVQTTGAPPVQVPFWQVSPLVQPLPSLQALPFALAGFEQMPVAGSQTPALWHWSEAVQVTAVPRQAPA